MLGNEKSQKKQCDFQKCLPAGGSAAKATLASKQGLVGEAPPHITKYQKYTDKAQLFLRFGLM